MIRKRTVVCLGVAQLVSWGTTYYLIGGFAELIAADLHWSPAQVQGGFSAALVTMGLVSSPVGRSIDRWGGRPVMAVGSLLSALGCTGVAVASDVPVYYAAWICLGLAMRCTLYDAAFATLARIGGPEAKGAMSQITLLGGLASTIFWPVGHLLAERLGWRGAVGCYAVFALLTLPLHLAIPKGRFVHRVRSATTTDPVPRTFGRRDRILAGTLYATIAMLTNVLSCAMSAEMIPLLASAGLSASLAVWVSTLRGIGQSSARLGEVLFGRRVAAIDLNLIASIGLPLCFIAGLWGGVSVAAAVTFTFVYGASNGLLTITRGTVPLALFDPATYGTLVGNLITPGLILSAARAARLRLRHRAMGRRGRVHHVRRARSDDGRCLAGAQAALSGLAAAVLRGRPSVDGPRPGRHVCPPFQPAQQLPRVRAQECLVSS